MAHFVTPLVLLLLAPVWCSECDTDDDTVALLQLGSNIQSGLHRSEASQLAVLHKLVEEQDAVLREQEELLQDGGAALRRQREQIAALKNEHDGFKERHEQISNIRHRLTTLLSLIGTGGSKSSVEAGLCRRMQICKLVGSQGPPGPPGPPGPAGPAGIAAEMGPVGLIGEPGSIGEKGNAGPQGPSGPKGATGAIGNAGVQGAMGAQGDPGPKGPQGDSFFTLDSATQTVKLTDRNMQIMASNTSDRGNLVVGDSHTFKVCSNCFIAGMDNNAQGVSNTLAGTQNIVTGSFNSVNGGQLNSAAGTASSIGGGLHNKVTDVGAHVSGGDENQANTRAATVTGGVATVAGAIAYVPVLQPVTTTSAATAVPQTFVPVPMPTYFPPGQQPWMAPIG